MTTAEQIKELTGAISALKHGRYGTAARKVAAVNASLNTIAVKEITK